MPVVSINIGPKRVHLTAYCPDDELGLLALDTPPFRSAKRVATRRAGFAGRGESRAGLRVRLSPRGRIARRYDRG